jgi:hypothetical protein
MALGLDTASRLCSRPEAELSSSAPLAGRCRVEQLFDAAGAGAVYQVRQGDPAAHGLAAEFRTTPHRARIAFCGPGCPSASRRAARAR